MGEGRLHNHDEIKNWSNLTKKKQISKNTERKKCVTLNILCCHHVAKVVVTS